MSTPIDVTQSSPAGHSESHSRAIAVIATLAVSYVGISMAFTMPLSISIVLKLEKIAPARSAAVLSDMLVVASLCALIPLVVIGTLSDATTSRFGMRRPWFLASLVGIAAGSAVLAAAGSVAAVWIGFILVAMSAGTGIGALYAMVADQVPEALQSVAAGALGAATVAGAILGLFLARSGPTSSFFLFVLPALFAVVPGSVLLVVVKDRVQTEQVKITFRTLLSCFYIDRKRMPSLPWLLASTVLVFSLLAVANSYTYFLAAHFVEDAPASLTDVTFKALVLFNGIAFVVSLAVPRLLERVGHPRLMYGASAVLFVIGGLFLLTASSLPLLYVGYGIMGIAMGLSITLYMTMAMKVIEPSTNPGRDINLASSSATVASTLVAIIAPHIVDADGGGVRGLVIVAAVMTFASLLFLPKVRLS
ncbi:MFS transporter [Streptomyces fuscichromogenes]|uniref:MFS transporter n=1 Tax=Streptomyces fuscichromogenes TaxID=1324013 RepID=A0A918CWX5_9ACTN|nr:MFS transporter [Streptomyces fuscichromogenes]GGN40275.1 MFS transporter [Streptomyces fuscichromogenes]